MSFIEGRVGDDKIAVGCENVLVVAGCTYINYFIHAYMEKYSLDILYADP